MSGHTPGPWDSTKVNWDRCLIRHALPGDAHIPGYIAEVNNIGASFEANARLIAAAPELLEALQEAIAELDDSLACPRDEWDFYDKARAAIRKATGEPA